MTKPKTLEQLRADKERAESIAHRDPVYRDKPVVT